MAALAFDGASLQPLRGVASDATRPEYVTAKRRLQRLQATDARTQRLYILRVEGTHVVILADSSAEATTQAQPGNADQGAERAAGLQTVLLTGTPGIDGPSSDGRGSWVSAYARIRSENDGDGGSDTPMILGLDIAAADWNRDLALAAVRGALLVWTLLTFPVFAFLMTRRQGEQREAIRNLSEAVEQSHSAIVILDLEHRIEYANRGLCQQIGYSRRELLGRHWRDFIVGPESGATLADLLATIRTGRAWEGDWTNLRKDGTGYPVHGMVTPVKHRDGSMACFVAIFDDVSDAKRKEAELRVARDQARAGDNAKSHFLATMSHEVRTPLNGIVGFTSLLLDTPLSPEQREFVQTIRASGEALIQLTGDILDFSRIESGKLKLDPVACDPRECIEEALDLHAAKAAEKNVELLHRAAENVPASIIVDAGRLRQVLVNLVGNAVKFTETGEIEVAVAVREAAGGDSAAASERPANEAGSAHGDNPQRAVLEFTIRDTGIGIPPEFHGRLFKPFSQLDESSTRRYGGAGLGLAISKNLVELMGGEIELTSSPGRGTEFTFTVCVPVAAPHPPRRDLEGLQVGLGIRPGPLRQELLELLNSWSAVVHEADTAQALAGGAWDVALVEISEGCAAELAARTEPLPGLPPAQTVALVPIALSSELRAGLRKHFRLLVNRPVHHGPLFALLSGARPSAGAPAGPAKQFGLRVLVVEDNHVNQRLLQRVLTGLGCSHDVAANGREAIEKLSRDGGQIDVVILDLHMPELDGLSALELIRRGEAGDSARSVWVIALTADVRPEQRERGFALGLNDYLTKPLRVPALEEALHRVRIGKSVGRN